MTKWKKSSRSQGNGANCVETRHTGKQYQVRDSKLGDASPIFDIEGDDFGSLLNAARR